MKNKKFPLWWAIATTGFILLITFGLLWLIPIRTDEVIKSTDKQTLESDISNSNVFANNENTADDKTYFKSEEDFIREVKKDLLDGYREISVPDWKSNYEEVLVLPDYLPERFKYYDGVFIKEDPGIPTQIMTEQLWYDPLTFEFLKVTQEKSDSTGESTGLLGFIDKYAENDTITYPCHWTRYLSTYPIESNGMRVYGYMCVNSEDSKSEYEKILMSLHY